jgi:hypothetical protein
MKMKMKMKKDKWKKEKTFCPGFSYEPGQKFLQPKHPNRSHVVDFMSRLVTGPGQPFVPPPMSRVAGRDKRL